MMPGDKSSKPIATIEKNENHRIDVPFSVVEFYRNQTILITGVTGFVGKVLLEKFLRLSTIHKIYVLLRPKWGKNPKERLQELFKNSPAFNFYPLDFTKVQTIDGDLTKTDLGISLEDQQRLANEVNLVFHCAASVQFKGNLKIFIEQNVLGTDHIMKLCSKMIRLKVVIYVSTAYANCNLSYVEEKVYPIDFGSNIDEYIKKILWKYGDTCPKANDAALCGRPNCYTFSKAIAETLIVEKYPNLPVSICRPSIVTHAVQEPARGWCDTKNGVSGALILGGLGIARTMLLNLDCRADVIPVDFLANAMIVMASYNVSMPPFLRKKVIHLTSGQTNPITWGQMLEYGRKAIVDKPFLKQIRPLASLPQRTDSYFGLFNHYCTKIFSHYCFALLVDLIVFICGHQPFLMKITKQMHRGFDTLQPFTNREWFFRYENYRDIFNSLSEHDQQIFPSDISKIDWYDYIDGATLGTRRYMMKEDDSSIEQAIRRQKLLNRSFGIGEAILSFIIFSIIWWTIMVD
ncbi:Fatty acyl-CoA reductase 2 [Sarcoptes scabiei]|uniref:Fatty acyl-CoA reductase n=1 Tax=Sarcoptes scabiei TaxID=52283 RepID=A0A834VJ33_SARSC|nr:Fatty acyl-CoA reductase 2 [Sarcoptes scabiei]